MLQIDLVAIAYRLAPGIRCIGERRLAGLAAIVAAMLIVAACSTGIGASLADTQASEPSAPCENRTVISNSAEHPGLVADCIRAVYRGAPEDYAQVQDIPADRLLTPDADGRYTINRGQRVTVVSAARLPRGFNRFVLNQRPSSEPRPTASWRLIPPVGTTFAFTASDDAYAADRFELDLHAARTRPGGGKPIPGAVVVTTQSNVRSDPLTLQLTSSRELCTANTLTELNWTITGGKPPYALTIDGQTVDATADSHRLNCGAIPTDPLTNDPVANPTKTFRASVSDSQATPATAAASTDIELAPPLPAMTTSGEQHVRDFGLVALWFTDPAPSYRGSYAASLTRWRLAGTETWSYNDSDPYPYGPSTYYAEAVIHALEHGTEYEVAVAAMRNRLESQTPQALNWTRSARLTTSTYLANVVVTTTHDTITMEWDRQPSVNSWGASLSSPDGYVQAPVEDVGDENRDDSAADRHRATFPNLPPDTEFSLLVARWNVIPEAEPSLSFRRTVRTAPAPTTGYTPLPRGPQNVQARATGSAITVTWDAPYAGARDAYTVMLFHPNRTGRVERSIYQPPYTVTFGNESGRRRYIEPGTAYRILVIHRDIVNAKVDIGVTTLTRDQHREADRARFAVTGPCSQAPGFEHIAPWACRTGATFSWPYVYSPDLRLTADVWALSRLLKYGQV